MEDRLGQGMNDELRKVLKRLHDPLEVMLVCVRWYAAYPPCLRHLEEMMAERGIAVDHSTVHRGAVKMLPVLAAVFRRRKRPVGASWRMDETYAKVSGQWKYLYRGVDRNGATVDVLLRANRDHAAAHIRSPRREVAHPAGARIQELLGGEGHPRGIETAHMIRKCQLDGLKDRALSAAQQFYSLAF